MGQFYNGKWIAKSASKKVETSHLAYVQVAGIALTFNQQRLEVADKNENKMKIVTHPVYRWPWQFPLWPVVDVAGGVVFVRLARLSPFRNRRNDARPLESSFTIISCFLYYSRRTTTDVSAADRRETHKRTWTRMSASVRTPRHRAERTDTNASIGQLLLALLVAV